MPKLPKNWRARSGPSVESTQSGTGGSETGIVTQPVLDANQILDFYKCPWQNPLALVDPISGYWELICFVSLIAGDTGYAADKLTETDHRLNAGLIPSPASPPRFSGRSQGRMLLSVP